MYYNAGIYIRLSQEDKDKKYTSKINEYENDYVDKNDIKKKNFFDIISPKKIIS